jgi:hypothetical protein
VQKTDEVESDLSTEPGTAVEERIAAASRCLFAGLEPDWIFGSDAFKARNGRRGMADASNQAANKRKRVQLGRRVEEFDRVEEFNWVEVLC